MARHEVRVIKLAHELDALFGANTTLWRARELSPLSSQAEMDLGRLWVILNQMNWSLEI